MTEVISASTQHHFGPSQPRDIPQTANAKNGLSKKTLPPAISTASASSQQGHTRNGHLSLGVFSPVHENGSYAFDRVIKCGVVQKRTRKTKNWRSIYLVLRPNLLSIYKNEKESKLRKQIHLSDLTTVAYLKDPKRDHVFGLFSPSRNFHLEAASEQDAREWVELIRKESRIAEEEEEMVLSSPGDNRTSYHAFGRRASTLGEERFGSSSPEPTDMPVRTSTTKDGVRYPALDRSTSNFDYSGNERASHSDLSDSPEAHAFYGPRSRVNTSKSETSVIDAGVEDERVVWHGYLYILKSKSGVRQWKRVWAVLRPKKLALYKNEGEYSAILLLPLSSVINAVEIDPVSKSKQHCMQVIAEEKSYRFCAPDEETLTLWLGSIKSQLAKNKEASRRRKEEEALGSTAAANVSSAPR